MLHELVEYARQNNISAEPGFTPKVVRWLVLFTPKGDLTGVMDLRDSDNKRSKGREFAKAPHLRFAGDTPMRQFLVDTAQYALLYDQAEPNAKLLAKHEYFLKLLRDASECEPAMALIADRLTDKDCLAQIHSLLAQQSPAAKAADSVTFAIDQASGPQILVEQSNWHDWWRGYFPGLFVKKTKGKAKGKTKPVAQMRCFITGEQVEPAATHPKIKGLGDVGGNIETTLVGFNCDSFCSYGLVQSANAAVSQQSAAEYAAALNKLIEQNSRRLAGAKVAFWYTGEVPVSPIAMVDNCDEMNLQPVDGASSQKQPSEDTQTEAMQAKDSAMKLLRAIRDGQSEFDLKNCRYCAITLSGNSGRVVVRDWMEGQFEQLAANTLQWFEDLNIINYTGRHDIPLRKFEALLTCGLRERKQGEQYDNWIKPVNTLREQLWKCAIVAPNLPIPRSAVEKAVVEHVKTIMTRQFLPPTQLDGLKRGKDNHNDSMSPKVLSLTYSRLATIKAYIIRQSRIQKTGETQMHTADCEIDTSSDISENNSIQSALNVNHPRKAYHCGRLMAALEMIQQLAQGELGITIAQSHYASASTRPVAAMPRLQTLTQHHLPKIKDPELRDKFKHLLTDINGKIKDSIPRTFDLEDQCYFHLGYYHQRPHWPQTLPDRRHTTLRGTEKVRSKSEVIVANLLCAMKIDYIYEKPLKIEKQSILPDFTILNNNFGKPIYIEHLGMLDSYKYKTDWEKKEKLYRAANILPLDEGIGENGILITTTEANGSIDCTELSRILSQISETK